MTLDAETGARENPLAPVSSRLTLGLPEGLPDSDEPASDLRPFGLRFARDLERSNVPPWPPRRYCPDRQVLVTDEPSPVPLDDELRAVQTTTLVYKDGHGSPQEDWKPDPTYCGSP